MRLYRVHLYSEQTGSAGFAWCWNKGIAEARAREFKQTRVSETVRTMIDAIEFKPTKTGIMALLKQYASHPDNG